MHNPNEARPPGKMFLHLLKWDLVLFHRNNLIVLSAVVAALYVGLFYLLKPLGNLTTVLVILLFNDPVVTGFLFAGVILLFDKGQHTLQALRVTPAPLSWYLLSKSLLLAALSTLSALIMTVAAHGWSFRYGHLIYGVFATALFFTFSGFLLGGRSRTFNDLLLYTIGFLTPMALPFLELFGIGGPWLFAVLPSSAGIKLLRAAFTPLPAGQLVYGYVYLAVAVAIAWRLMLREVSRRTLEEAT